METRLLSDNELQILNKLLSADFQDVSELRKQVHDLRASDTGDSDNYKSVYLHVKEVTPSEVETSMPVEGTWDDEDGTPIYCLLHIQDGLLHELEFYKAGATDITKHYDAQNMSIKVR